MNAEQLLTCHRVCRADRELMLNDAALVERLRELPKEYRAELVQACVDNLVCLPAEEQRERE